MPQHDSPCGRMHIIANLYDDPAGFGDVLFGLEDLELWPVWWIATPDASPLSNCFALVFHDPGVTRAEAEKFVRERFLEGGLRPEWYGPVSQEEIDAYYKENS
jgi:hypothetical protein